MIVLPKKTKIVLIGLAVLSVVAVVVFLILKNRKTTIASIEVDETKTTITDTQATLIASHLLSAMDKYGTDEQSIIDNLTGLNQNDLLLVIKKFGTPSYNGQAQATDWLGKTFFSSQKDLVGWLREELSGKPLETVKQIFTTNNVPF